MYKTFLVISWWWATPKFGLGSKVQTVYCTFARIVTAVIVLAFGDLSHVLTFKFEPIEIKQPMKLSDTCMKPFQLSWRLSWWVDEWVTSKFGLAAKVKTVYCAFARIVTAVIVLAFGDLSHLLTFKFEPIEIKQAKKLSDRCMKLFSCSCHPSSTKRRGGNIQICKSENGVLYVCQNRDSCHRSGIWWIVTCTNI